MLKKENKKYNQLMDAGRELFWKHGFKRVTIDEICGKADVSKMTFYKYFPDKIELAKSVFGKVVSEGEERLKSIIKEDCLPTEKIRKMIMLKLEGTNDISPEFMQDFYFGSSELKSFVEMRTMRSWNWLINDFKEAQKAGIFRKDFKPELMIKMQQKIVELLDDRSVAAMYDSQQEMVMEFAKLMFYGIAPNE
jgi:AcrR family transcriptional regulator